MREIMSRDIVVLGAGMIGVCVAYHLLRESHKVTLVDRSAPGRETSYGKMRGSSSARP
jgi:D-amino-acid dehydrogenase